MSSMSCWSIVLPLSQCQQMFPSCSLQETLQGHEEAPGYLVGQAPKYLLPSIPCRSWNLPYISLDRRQQLKGVKKGLSFVTFDNASLNNLFFVISCPPFILNLTNTFSLSSRCHLLYCHGSLDQGGY